jgi:hypothetical protein
MCHFVTSPQLYISNNRWGMGCRTATVGGIAERQGGPRHVLRTWFFSGCSAARWVKDAAIGDARLSMLPDFPLSSPIIMHVAF